MEGADSRGSGLKGSNATRPSYDNRERRHRVRINCAEPGYCELEFRTLGISRLSEQAREGREDRRIAPRHALPRILSGRTVAALLLDSLCGELLARLAVAVDRILARTLDGTGLYDAALTL